MEEKASSSASFSEVQDGEEERETATASIPDYLKPASVGEGEEEAEAVLAAEKTISRLLVEGKEPSIPKSPLGQQQRRKAKKQEAAVDVEEEATILGGFLCAGSCQLLLSSERRGKS